MLDLHILHFHSKHSDEKAIAQTTCQRISRHLEKSKLKLDIIIKFSEDFNSKDYFYYTQKKIFFFLFKDEISARLL